jgi:glycerol-3-phosphate acyltransferase PlsX
MRIVLDAMGSDTHPEPEVLAAIRAVRELDVEIALVGRQQQLEALLRSAGGTPSGLEVIDAPEVLEMTDKAASSARRKSDNSMSVGMHIVKDGRADAFLTAGNTGAAMATALFTLGRIRGLKRPALTALFPVRGGRSVVLDIGANADCKPEYLLQFAQMGSVYAEKVLGRNAPKVALLSNGEEAGKGNALVKEAYTLIAESNLNFIGNVEGKELFGGQADVVIADGFTGNILLKSSEAVAKLITDLLKEKLTAGPRTMLGGLLAKPAFDEIRKMMDPGEYGAVPLLGIDGLVLVGHGRSDEHAIFNGIRVATQAVEAGLLPALRASIQERLVTGAGTPEKQIV